MSNAMDFSENVPDNVITRGVGDIENDLGFVTGQIEDLESQLAALESEKSELQEELDQFDEWEEEDEVSG